MVGYRVLVLLVFLTVVVSLSGCIHAFREGPVQPPASWPIITASGQQLISLFISGETITMDEKHKTSYPAGRWAGGREQRYHGWGSIPMAYSDSGLFSEVTMGAADTDLRAEIHVLRRHDYPGMWFFVGLFTAFIVPISVQNEVIITTTIKNRELQSLGTYEKAETVTEWAQLFLIFLAPFHWPTNVVWDELMYDLNRSVISQAYEEGVIQ